MESRQLKYFLEVAKHKNISKGSESLPISQPAMSKVIKSLEDELGVTLMIRKNKPSELTDAGVIVKEYEQKVQSLIDEMAATLNDTTNLSRGQINIGLLPIIGSLFFPMAKFHEHYPNVQINITEYGDARVVIQTPFTKGLTLGMAAHGGGTNKAMIMVNKKQHFLLWQLFLQP